MALMVALWWASTWAQALGPSQAAHALPQGDTVASARVASDGTAVSPLAHAAPLTLQTLVARASWCGPQARRAQAQAQALLAQTTGSATSLGLNPTVSLSGGQHWSAPPRAELALYARLAWPLEVSGAHGARRRAHAINGGAARALVASGQQQAAHEALGLAIHLDAARAQRARITALHEVQLTLLDVAQKRFAAGTTGADDVALARIVVAQSRAEQLRREADVVACGRRLMRALGAPVAHEPGPITLEWPDVHADVEAYISAAWVRRDDLHTLTAHAQVARASQVVSDREAVPVPAFTAQGGVTPERFWEVGAEAALPIVQRNQRARAEARAAVVTTDTAAALMRADIAAAVKVAHTQFLAERAACKILQSAAVDIDRVETLAHRAYALGRDTLGQALVHRREAQLARQALIDAATQVHRARLDLAFATGEFR